MGWLEGDVVVVTGGGSGLGAAVARRCVAEGAKVAVIDLMPEKVAAMSEELGDDGIALEGDVRDWAALENAREKILERFGKVTSLIGTQGVWDGNLRFDTLGNDEIDKAFTEVFEINVKGYLTTARVFTDTLRENDGTIVMTLSNAAFAADGGGIFYTAAKHATVGMVRQLAFELAPEIRVNGVAPSSILESDLRGPASLGLGGHSQTSRPAEVKIEGAKKFYPLQIFASADDYTSLYVLLASAKHARTMTGEVILADQGMLQRGFGTRTDAQHRVSENAAGGA
jgi:NAD(P)-dependent dehydrogenase (short-subunit alcohol dehydrogenase family)